MIGMPHIAGRMFNTPLMFDKSKAAAIMSGLGGRVLGFEGPSAEFEKPNRAMSTLVDDFSKFYTKDGDSGPYAVFGNVALIPVIGSLVHRGAYIGNSSGVTSYEGIGAQIEAAESDHAVRAIALELDSFGGEVAGAFDLADRIRATSKPVYAFVSEAAYSAGYIIASQADKIILPRTGGVGSIGVVQMHADYSKELEGQGIKITLITAGLLKGDGNPYEALPERVFKQFKAEGERLRLMFAQTVDAGRKGKFTTEQAMATEAALFMGQAAVDAGLADEVSDVKAAFNRFVSENTGRSIGLTARTGVSNMAKDEGRMDAAVNDVADFELRLQAAVEAERARAEAGAQAALQAAVAAAVDAERAAVKADADRKAAIMGHPDAKGREKLASALAEMGLTVEAAATALAASPKGYSALMEEAGGAGVSLTAEIETAPVKAGTKKVMVI